MVELHRGDYVGCVEREREGGICKERRQTEREGGREGVREGGKERGREGEGGREGREGGKERGREGGIVREKC